MNVSISLPIPGTKNRFLGILSTLPETVEIKATVTFSDAPFPDVEYNSIKYKGIDLLPLFDNFPEGAADDIMDYFMTAVLDAAKYRHQPKQAV